MMDACSTVPKGSNIWRSSASLTACRHAGTAHTEVKHLGPVRAMSIVSAVLTCDRLPTYSLHESGRSRPESPRPAGEGKGHTEARAGRRHTRGLVPYCRSGPARPHCPTSACCQWRIGWRWAAPQLRQEGLVLMVHLDCLPGVHFRHILWQPWTRSAHWRGQSASQCNTACDALAHHRPAAAGPTSSAPWRTSRPPCSAAGLEGGTHQPPSWGSRSADGLHMVGGGRG